MLRFIDSFDHYSTAQVARKWTSLFGNIAIASGEGRSGSSALKIGGVGVGDLSSWMSVSLGPDNVWNCHFSVRPTPGSTTILGKVLCVLWDDNIPHISLEAQDDSLIAVWRGGIVNFFQNPRHTRVAVCDPPAVVMGAETHIQLRVVFHTTNGSIVVKVNDVQVLSLTGIRTINANTTGNEFATRFSLKYQEASGAMAPVYFDDVVITDDVTPNAGLLGDVRVTAIFPDADTADKNYARSTGTDNFVLVNENPANDDTDYVESSTVGHKDMYHYTLGSIGQVLGVQTCASDKKTDGGTRNVRHNLRFGVGPTELNGQNYGPATGYLINRNIFDTDIEGDNEVEAGPEITG